MAQSLRSRLQTRIATLTVAVPLTALSVGCAAQVDQPTGESDSADTSAELAGQPAVADDQARAQKTADVAETRRHRYRRSTSVVFDTAVKYGDLSEAQLQTVQELKADLRFKRTGHKQRHAEMRETTLDIIRTGAEDSPELRAALKKVGDNIEEYVTRHAEAMKTLHSTLEPQQRADVAVMLRAELAERSWRKHRDTRTKDVKKFTRYLVLDAVQVGRLKTIQRETQATRKSAKPTQTELSELAKAFERDDFATALDAFTSEKMRRMRDGLQRGAGYARSALSILDADQRELLADLVDRGPEAVGLSSPRTRTRK